MRWGLVLLAVIAQLAVLAVMAGEREWIFRTGEVVHLRTAPVDPRDLFRGDFVRLQYELNRVRPSEMGAALKSAKRKRHDVVYTALRPAGEGLFEAAGTTLEAPEGLYIKGRIDRHWRFGTRGNSAFVKYGIEQYFVEQGAGKAIERRRGDRDDLQVPMEVEVAISGSGKAVIRDYRWSKLGMRIEMMRAPKPRNRNEPPPEGPLSPKLKLTLANVSQQPLALADPGNSCGFSLVVAEWVKNEYLTADQSCAAAKTETTDLITLSLGETYVAELDLAEPRWHVRDGDAVVEMGALNNFTQFRIEYQAPPLVDGAEANNLWQGGRMPSRAFNANGFVD
jgi:uncharacterized membrane-anchored protein